jgi:GNAT superfamily N-acetyltransferase
MPLVFRPARAEDVQPAQGLVVGSINDLTERHGFGPMASVRPANFQLFSLQDDTDGQWIAEDGGQIVGCAFSWVCDDLWFLAELFISPERQGQGIGNELLKRTLDHARKRGASKKALIIFTFNRVSQGLYIRHGLFPRLPVYFVGVARDQLTRRLPAAPLRTVPLENTASHLRNLAQIDAAALGLSREKHHRYLIGDKATQGVLLYAGNDCAGYAYIADGHIGPLAVSRPDAMADAFTTALTLAAAGSAAQVSAFLPGASDAALSLAIAHGMRITFPMVLVSAGDFGNWTQYLPRNPGFM